VVPVGKECFKPESKRHFTYLGPRLSTRRPEEGSEWAYAFHVLLGLQAFVTHQGP
jgi:hypothetical protein